MDTVVEPYQWIKNMRKSGNVLRLHTEPSLGPQTLAHHQYNVAMLAYYLTNSYLSKAALITALTHDFPEYWTGDIPANTKWLLSDSANEELHQIDVAMFKEMRLDNHHIALEEGELEILKFADKFELMMQCVDKREEGNLRADLVFSRCCDWYSKQDNFPENVVELFNDLTCEYLAIGGNINVS